MKGETRGSWGRRATGRGCWRKGGGWFGCVGRGSGLVRLRGSDRRVVGEGRGRLGSLQNLGLETLC